MGTFTITQTPDSKNAYLYPTGNGCAINCMPFGDIPNYRCLDDPYNGLNKDDDYVYIDGASTVSDTYEMENHGTLSGTINYVKGCCRAKSDLFPPAHDFIYKVILSKDSTCTSFDTSRIMPLSTGFTTFENAWQTNPFTSNSWEWSEIDDLQVGFEASSPSVTTSPFVVLPSSEGDRTDITDVTFGYEHWEAVVADRPLTQVYETGAAWKYDLYEFIMASSDYYTDACYDINKFGDYVLSTDAINDYTYIYSWEKGKMQFLAKAAGTGGYRIESDGTYFFIGANEKIYVLEYNDSNNTLTKKQTITLGAGADVQDLKYANGYLYAACNADGLRVYSDVNGTLTLVDSNSDASKGVAIDDNYVYDSGNNQLRAYTFDGTTLSEQDNVAVGNIQYQLACDNSGNIFVPCGVDGLRAYSFDGSTLTLEDTIDNGGTYVRVVYADGYIHVGDAVAPTNGIRAYTYSAGSLALVGTYTDVDAPIRGIAVDGQFVFTRGTDGTGIILTFNGSSYDLLYDSQNGMLPDYLDDNIASVTVVAKMGKEYDATDEADIRGRMCIKTHATEYQSDYWTLEYPKKWYAYTWSTNPNTGSPWTLDEVKALQAGIGLYGNGTKYASCSVCQIIIAATSNISPEIRTSQVYLKINYTPSEETATLNQPQEVSLDHDRINNMINFWRGSREVYGINRSGKRMVLRGTEYTSSDCSDPGSRIEAIREFGDNGANITIDDFDMSCYNGTYKIRSFGWVMVNDKPDTFEWILELEDTEL